MHASTTILIAILTSIFTSVGTVYVVERLDLLGPRAAAVVDTPLPDLRGLAEAEARAMAAASHVVLLIGGREPSSSDKPGTVIRQSIPAGQRVPHDHPVSVVIAEAVPTVPSVTGLGEDAAKLLLTERGYRAEVSAVAHAEVAAGVVIRQSPEGEAPQPRGALVKVEVSSGPGEVELPKVTGVSVTAAQKQLEELGVKPVVRWVSLAETATHVVLSQKPAAGEKVKPGSEVVLTACR